MTRGGASQLLNPECMAANGKLWFQARSRDQSGTLSPGLLLGLEDLPRKHGPLKRSSKRM